MTYLQKYKQNKKLIEAYDAFLPEVGNYDDRLKLMTEIGRLNMQNKAIEKMEYKEVRCDSNDYTLKINSTINNDLYRKYKTYRD